MISNKIDIELIKTKDSRINQFDPQNIQFGKLYSDHMLIAHYDNGVWGKARIEPFRNLCMHPATTFIHYGQSIFEGIKAYKNEQGEALIFRPHDNWKRFNVSAERMGMPAVPEDLFMEGLKELIALDSNWIPSEDGTSLYIRPFMFATDEFIGVKPAEQFTFMIITSPAGPYYSKPVSIYVHDEYTRAFPGGIGYTKAAGNYGASMYPTMKVREMGYDQILWTDAVEHKWVQEIGTMNVFFVIGDKVVTPDLLGGTILAGVTRMSVLTLLKEKGIAVEERPISILELEEAYKQGKLKEAFGTGTAASIAPIGSLTYQEHLMELPDVATWEIANWLKTALNDIRYGRVADTHNWVVKL